MNDDFVEAYSVATGAKQTIPRAWLEPGFPPGRDFRKTPLQIVADAAAGERPTDGWTKVQLEDFAGREGIALGDAKVKADILSAIESVLAAGDAEMATAATPPSAGFGVDEASYAAALEQSNAALAAAQAQIADLEAQLAALPQAVADGARAGTAAGQGPTDSDVTPAPDSTTTTSTTENPGNGEEEN